MTIEFLEDVHAYLYNGVIIPSVSELIRFKFPDAYAGIPDRVLKKKANYGTKVHALVESYANGDITMEEVQKKRIDPDIKIAVEQFEAIRKNWAFYIKDMEKIVCWKGRYAGTYDMRIEGDYLIDLKTTSVIHEEWLRWQLGLYYLAAGLDKHHGFVIWLPKGKMAQVRQINVVSKEECIQLVDDYEKAQASGS